MNLNASPALAELRVSDFLPGQSHVDIEANKTHEDDDTSCAILFVECFQHMPVIGADSAELFANDWIEFVQALGQSSVSACGGSGVTLASEVDAGCVDQNCHSQFEIK